MSALCRVVDDPRFSDSRERIVAVIEREIDILRDRQGLDGGWGYYDFEYILENPSGDQSTSFNTAAVLLALEEGLGRQVALKLLPPELAERDPTFVTRFLREARSAAAVRHPNVVGVLDAGQVDGTHYIAFEFVDGASLEAIVKEGGPLPEARILELTYGLARGLAAVHERGLIHRDVKPDNVLVREADGCPLLADLGLAKREDDGETALTMAGAVLGTPRYMSPDQLRGSAEPTVDVYALGLILFELLTGEVATGDAETPAELIGNILSEPRPAPSSVDDSLPASLDELCARLLHQDPAQRPQHAGEVEALLAGLVGVPSLPRRRHSRQVVLDPVRMGVRLQLRDISTGPSRGSTMTLSFASSIFLSRLWEAAIIQSRRSSSVPQRGRRVSVRRGLVHHQ